MSLSATIRRTFDRFMGGRGEFSITVPVMDGALKPNDYLERLPSLAMVEDADNAVATKDGLLVSSGPCLLRLDAGGAQGLHSAHEAPIACVAASAAGALAIGLDGVGIRIAGGRHDGRTIAGTACPTAALFLDEDTLVVGNGSAAFPAGDWSRDLLHHGRSGAVLRIDLASGGVVELAAGLRFPSGLCLGEDGRIVVAEAWRHRLIALDAGRPSQPRELLADLPAYPGRIARSASGGYWLALFAVRSQLQEFVLRENRFRRQMIAEVDPAFWIAPALSSGRSFKEPLQAGGVIRLGIHKPWAPTRSYGLVVRLDADFQPAWSMHSRADGRRHGVTSLAEAGGRLVVTSRGRGEVMATDHTALVEPDDLIVLTEAAQ